MYKITFICPGYNEELNLLKLFKRIINIKRSLNIAVQTIFINDASSDGTKKKLNNLRNRFSFETINNKKNLGFGASFFKGLTASKGQYVMLLPAEDVYTTKSLKKFISNGINNEATMSIYSNTYMRHPLRRLITFLISVFFNTCFRLNIKQYTGPFLYKRKNLKNFKINSKKFAFQIEIILKLMKKKVPLKYEYLSIKKKSGFLSSAISLNSLVDLVKMLFCLKK